ncbi:MAG: hypothetical protein ABIJ00_13790 [Candidatus Eisenbacteria bacterium]
MGKGRLAIGKTGKQEITLEEAEAASEIDAEALNRALELLARWALRRREKG